MHDHDALVLNEIHKDQSTISPLFFKINKLGFSVRTSNCLRKLDVNYVSDLVTKKATELLEIQNFGRKCLREVDECLANIGLYLGMKIPKEYLNYEESIVNDNTESKLMLDIRDISKPIIDQKSLPKLLISIDELAFSERTLHCLVMINVKYIGDLVQKSNADLLRVKNFGRKSLKEIVDKLALIDLQLDMYVPTWTTNSIQNSLTQFAKQIKEEDEIIARKLQETNPKISTIEDELFYLTSPVKMNNRLMVLEYFGWNGKPPLTLREVAVTFNVSHERVRQVCDMVCKKWKERYAFVPILEDTLQFIKDSIPIEADKLESMIQEKGISRKIICIDGIVNAASITNRKVAFKTISVSGRRMVLTNKSIKLIQLIISVAKKFVSKQGVVNIEDILCKLKELGRDTEGISFIITILETIEGFHWLHKEDGWFWLSSLPRNRVLNQIKKILSVSNSIDISELRTGVARYHRMEGFAPPRRVLLELCRHIPWCQVDGSSVTSSPPLNWKEVLADIEGTFCTILREHGPVMQREELEEMCLNSGIIRDTFFLYLSYSPIIAKYGIGLYGLRGSKVYPGYLESLSRHRKVQKVLEDFGWTSEGKIWLALKLSQSVITSGVFSVPSAIREILQGHYALKIKTADDNLIGEIVVKENRVWSLKSFFQRRGGEPNDYVVLVFDVTSREAFIYLGDIYLLDDFRPS